MNCLILKTVNKTLKKILVKGDYTKLKPMFKDMYESQSNILIPRKFKAKQSGIEYCETDVEILFVRNISKDYDPKLKTYESVKGGLVKEKIIGKYILIDKFVLEVEEKFNVYCDGVCEKLTGSEYLKKHIVPNMLASDIVYKLDNKICFKNTAVFCKNIVDSHRLYSFLYDLVSVQPFCNLTFIGSVPDSMRKTIFENIKNISNLTMNRIYRTNLK